MLVLFNFWDVGLVKMFVSFGFDVFVIISVGLVFFLGWCDVEGVVSWIEVLENVWVIVVVIDLLVVVDLENGYGDVL